MGRSALSVRAMTRKIVAVLITSVAVFLLTSCAVTPDGLLLTKAGSFGLFSGVKDADLILVLDEGKLIESGSHEELMVDSGYYRSIYESQLMPQEEAHLFNQNSAERGAADG